jgi:hypothetical protein
VCEAFYKLSKDFDWSDRLMFQRFEESLGTNELRSHGNGQEFPKRRLGFFALLCLCRKGGQRDTRISSC